MAGDRWWLSRNEIEQFVARNCFWLTLDGRALSVGHFSIDTVTFSVNYKFGGPVTARYW